VGHRAPVRRERRGSDLDGDGKVSYGEALPDANHLVAAARDFARNARDLDAAARRWTPNASDVFTALVVMTPTMSEYFGAWKNTRFVAGSEAREERASSAPPGCRTSPTSCPGSSASTPACGRWWRAPRARTPTRPGRASPACARSPRTCANREADGERFTPEQADALGSEAQERAEAIAAQVSQAAAKLNVEVAD
jgi:hypothetical protein